MDKPTVAVPARALAVPPRPAALVVTLSGSGAGANPVRSRAIAHRFQGAGLATLAFELLTPVGGNNRLDVPSQAERLVGRCAGSPLAVRRGHRGLHGAGQLRRGTGDSRRMVRHSRRWRGGDMRARPALMTAALDPCTGPAGKDLEGKIAFASDRTGNYEIFVMNTDGSGVTRVTDTPTDDREPVWSPDGTRIAFSSERSGNTDILVVNADGTGMAKLTDHPATDDEPAWQPRAPRPPVTSPSAARRPFRPRRRTKEGPMYPFDHPDSLLATRAGKGRAMGRLCSLLLASVLVLAGAACRRPDARAAGSPKPASPPIWVVSFGHSESDQAEEPGHLVDFENLFLPRIEDERATVIAYTVGLAGLGSPRVIARADFDTTGRDGDNPHKRAALRGLARRQLLESVRNGLASTKFSPGSDSFGGLAAAANFLAQYPPSSSKTLLAFGDQVANLPQGCVLDRADLSPGNRPALLRTCSPALPNLQGVRVMLAGAGYSEDEYINTALAQGLETLYREFFTAAGAKVDLYGPVAVNGGIH